MTSTKSRSRRAPLDVEAVRAAVTDWGQLLVDLGGLPVDLLDSTKEHPCPKAGCGGNTRCRFVDKIAGAFLCSHCFSAGNGDGFSTLAWLLDLPMPKSFPRVVRMVAEYVGIGPAGRSSAGKENGRVAGSSVASASMANGHPKAARRPRRKTAAEILAGQAAEQMHDHLTDDAFFVEVCASKNLPVGSAKAYGARVCTWSDTESGCGDVRVVELPGYSGSGQLNPLSRFGISHFASNEKFHKGRYINGGEHGLFLPHNDDGTVRLPRPGEMWVLLEGAKDSSAVHAHDYLSVGLPTAKMNAKFVELIRGIDIVIVPDLDKPGQEGAEVTAKRLAGIAASIRIARLPGEIRESKGADVRDVLAGPDGERAVRQAIDKAEEWKPADGEINDAPNDEISNFEEVDEDKIIPLSMPDIFERVNRRTHDKLMRLGTSLFISDQHGISFFDEPAALFGWLHQYGNVNWRGGPGFVSKPEFFHEARRIAQHYNAIEEIPHEPAIPGHFYACETPSPGDGSSLEAMVSLFRPQTAVDRELIRSLIVTTVWGGPPGCRPAYELTSEFGRGAGKTKTAELIAHHAGGHIDVSMSEDIEKLKSRLLSPAALQKRIALIDNAKSHRLSWSELEALITARTISGKRLYVGEGSRPNTLVWIITLNGVSLSADLAQRCIIIKLAKGDNFPTWYEHAISFLDANRVSIIADCIEFLRRPAVELDKHSRWASWEKSVLSRLRDPAKIQDVVAARQAECDVDRDEADLIQDFFERQFERLGYDSKCDRIRIPIDVVARWYQWSTGDKKASKTSVTRKLKQMASEGQLHFLSSDPSRSHGRCFIWTGFYSSGNSRTLNDLAKRIAESSQSEPNNEPEDAREELEDAFEDGTD